MTNLENYINAGLHRAGIVLEKHHFTYLIPCEKDLEM